MHDFDYDAMQKKRIARGAANMKRGSKSKKCTLPSDYLTAAQKRRLNGPVSTYKLDEPMTWESFKAMPEDLQKKYILNLQDTYQANNKMIGKMFGVTDVTICKTRQKLGIGAMGQSKMTVDEVSVRNAKWDAFCNGVVGGKPGEAKEPEVEEEMAEDQSLEVCGLHNTISSPVDSNEAEGYPGWRRFEVLKPEKTSMTFVVDSCDIYKAFEAFQQMNTLTGKVRIRFEVEAV